MKEYHEKDKADLIFKGYNFHSNISCNLLLIHPNIEI